MRDVFGQYSVLENIDLFFLVGLLLRARTLLLNGQLQRRVSVLLCGTPLRVWSRGLPLEQLGHTVRRGRPAGTSVPFPQGMECLARGEPCRQETCSKRTVGSESTALQWTQRLQPHPCHKVEVELWAFAWIALGAAFFEPSAPLAGTRCASTPTVQQGGRVEGVGPRGAVPPVQDDTAHAAQAQEQGRLHGALQGPPPCTDWIRGDAPLMSYWRAVPIVTAEKQQWKGNNLGVQVRGRVRTQTKMFTIQI